MNRRDFFKIVAAGLAAAGAAELDYDRLLYVPGARKIFLPSQNIIAPDAATVDQVLKAHNPAYRVPRYHVTVKDGAGQPITAIYDTAWQLMNGKELEASGQMHARDLQELQAALNSPTIGRDMRLDPRTFKGYMGTSGPLPDLFGKRRT